MLYYGFSGGNGSRLRASDFSHISVPKFVSLQSYERRLHCAAVEKGRYEWAAEHRR